MIHEAADINRHVHEDLEHMHDDLRSIVTLLGGIVNQREKSRNNAVDSYLGKVGLREPVERRASRTSMMDRLG